MKNLRAMLLFSACMLPTIGCAAKVETTEDSTKVEAEGPKIEVNKAPDLNPATDDDVDIDTPAPGDS